MILSRNELASLSGIRNVYESNRQVRNFTAYSADTNVFLSHKHSDKAELQAVKKILEDCGARPYVDWQDPSMPSETRAETALKIKQKIISSNKFIFIATSDALIAPWCNWEIGFGDATKSIKDSIALFPVKENNGTWKGNEYLQLYPTIEYEDGTTTYTGGAYIPRGYYVEYPSINGSRNIIPLKDWLLKKY